MGLSIHSSRQSKKSRLCRSCKGEGDSEEKRQGRSSKPRSSALLADNQFQVGTSSARTVAAQRRCSVAAKVVSLIISDDYQQHHVVSMLGIFKFSLSGGVI